MKLIVSICIFLLTFASEAQQLTFSEEALNDVFLSEANEETTFSEVLQKYRGKTVVIDIWATWCKNCITGMPKVKKLQKKYKDVTFLFLSLDKDTESWKKGISKYEMEGEHYYIPSGWKGGFCSTINLDWIPRYMIVNPKGVISLYKAIKADDKKIAKILNSK
ncbi:TlpA family protein disulfide reductase [Ulvibacter antarcticus]|uniref:Thioredoxin-like protein n=1 Tax=Ulvibacter antarcticus TaxID=442714 RepID=A0A3L9YAU1_9FLAO|nr:thioredoxin family protein [Ulvibacter antarcticus]RMA57831.1 thioredoxin-like protein [Ulvibacter antarcticus]